MGEEELLAQIGALLEEYLAMGTGTPVEAEAAALLSAIQGATGGGEGMAPPEEGMMPPDMPPEGEAPPEEAGGLMAGMMPSRPPTSLEDASALALEDSKKRKKSKAY
jgi:hypothetical protein